MTGLVGLPLFVIFSIFASGVYCGVTRADRVVDLEQRWLGVEPPPGRLTGGGSHEANEPNQSTDSAGDATTLGDTNTDQANPDQANPDQANPVAQPNQPKLPATDNPTPIKPDARPQPDAQLGLAVANADPVGPELRQRFEETRVVRVQLMVDPALVVARKDWLGYIASLFETTKASYAELFGIDLQLHGVVVWDAAVGATNEELEQNLATRPFDGADVLLGLVARERPPKYAAPRWADAVNGDHALVFADLEQTDRYYRNILRSLAVLFGAEPTLDTASKQLGSFMSEVPLAASGPALDPDNRGRVIINKRRPFVERSPETGDESQLEADKPEQPGHPESEGR